MFRITIFLLSFLVITACSNREVYISGPAVEKSIMVPAGLGGTAKAIKNVFRGAGWKTFVTGTSSQTTGTIGENVNLNTGRKYPARYSAYADSNPFDFCIGLTGTGRAIHYNISIVDNVSGEEVAAFSGSECESNIEKNIREGLKDFL